MAIYIEGLRYVKLRFIDDRVLHCVSGFIVVFATLSLLYLIIVVFLSMN